MCQNACHLRLLAVRYLARDILSYEFAATDHRLLPGAEPGAHIGLHLPNGLLRQYSLLHSGAALRSYTVGVKLDALGRGGSRWLHEQARPGMLLEVDPPRNNFPLNETAAHSVLIAGGIGVTPMLPMIERLQTLRRSWELHYACRSREYGAFLDLLGELPGTRVHLDEEANGAPLDVAARLQGVRRDAHLYCCGPAPMLKAFEAATAAWPRAQVHVEYFTPKEAAARAGGYVVQLAKSGMELPVPPGKTILQVLVDAGINVPSSCEEGVCGSCEIRVLAGKPDHRDAILSDAERAAGKSMMVCCSGALSERLVLDL